LNGLSALMTEAHKNHVSNPPPWRDRELAFTPDAGARFTATAAPIG
jgi:hypothetical protein